MTCGLSDEELFILYRLYTSRCFKASSGYHSKKLSNLIRKKFNKDSKKNIQKLKNEGYIGTVGKSPGKYYIADKTRSFCALGQHGFNVTRGIERPL